MKLCDANLLLYAVNSKEPLHKKSREWLENSLSDEEPFGFDWTVLLAFLRISTRPGIFPKPLPVPDAFNLIDAWLNQPCTQVLVPTPKHSAISRNLILPLGAGGNLTSDAHLAALALEYGATLYSADGDFKRFAGLTFVNPVE